MGTKIINLSLQAELVELIDAQAKREYATRSEYVKRAVMAQLKADNALTKDTALSYEEARKAHLKQFLQEYQERAGMDKIL